jgi:PAS domain S-box-containing protein
MSPESDYSFLIDSLTDCAFVILDAEGRVTGWNAGAERLTGYSPREIVGQPASMLRTPDEIVAGKPEAELSLARREGRSEDEGWHVRKDGERFWGRTIVTLLRTEGGEVRGYGLVIRDLTERRMAEARAEGRRSFLVQVTRLLALSSSLDYREMLSRVAKVAVPQFADWCAVDIVEDTSPLPVRVAVEHPDPEKVALAQRFSEKYPTNPQAKRGIVNVIRTGQSEFYPEISDRLLEASAMNAEHLRDLRALSMRSAVLVPITDGKRVQGVMTLVLSESDRHYTDEDRELLEEVGRRAGVAIENARLYTSEKHARAAADAASRMKDEFLATVSHELRTPLNAILGWAKLLHRPDFDAAKRARATDTIERNAIAMAQLIEDLLDVSRIISGKMRLDVTRVELEPVILAAVDAIRPATEAKEITLVRQLHAEGATVQGDAGRLQQVVWNLLSNAVKFTPRAGKIAIALSKPNDVIEIRVSDSGKGISAPFLAHVFDPFRQAESGISRTAGGLGLGLAITRHLVELHGGRIEAESAGEGKGASFVVRIPVASSPPAQAQERARPFEPLPQLRGVKVLAVDDDADSRQLLRTVLEECGTLVTTASNVEEALAAFERERPDILVSDIGMPGENGFDLIRRIRAYPTSRGGAVPAAALTAYARAEDRQKVLSTGYNMHVPKPVDPAELVSVIAQLMRITPSL